MYGVNEPWSMLAQSTDHASKSSMVYGTVCHPEAEGQVSYCDNVNDVEYF